MKQLIVGILMFWLAAPVVAYEPLVVKNEFVMPTFTTEGRATIKNVKVGWEAYGKLNKRKNNVILICHPFASNSHAAGKYTVYDEFPGYWDMIIGSGKAIDTDKYYVISVDSLVNAGWNNPMVITTGPASINPDTGKRYGLSFPIVTIGDFINVQKALLKSLGIKKLHAVMGASMGALQTYEWGATYPEMVERLIPVIGAGQNSNQGLAWLNTWATAIKQDSMWKNGAYESNAQPLRGITEAYKVLYLASGANGWLYSGIPQREWDKSYRDPAVSLANGYEVNAYQNWLWAKGAATTDANHFLYLVKANQTFVTGGKPTLAEGLALIKAPTFMVYSKKDQIFLENEVLETKQILEDNGTPVDSYALDMYGHLDGVFGIGEVSSQIEQFLSCDLNNCFPNN